MYKKYIYEIHHLYSYLLIFSENYFCYVKSAEFYQ